MYYLVVDEKLSVKTVFEDKGVKISCEYVYFPLRNKLMLDVCIVLVNGDFKTDAQKRLEEVVKRAPCDTVYFTYQTAIERAMEHFKKIVEEFYRVSGF